MIRKTGIKILIEPKGIGYTATPVSKYWRRRFALHMHNYTGHRSAEVYFQGLYDLPETVVLNWQYDELVKGWDICILVDPWEFGHWLGYDAQIVAERKG